jgi:DNA repair protein RadD
MKTLRPYQKKIVIDTILTLRESDEPALIMASVGAGKSLIIAEILKLFEKKGKKALCLVSNAELVRNNAQTFEEQGGTPSVFCSSLKQKCIKNNIIFATPQTVCAAIKKNHEISQLIFNLIIVDEAHMINYKSVTTTFMRILRHFKNSYSSMRLLGATGTNYRYRGESIVGSECLFKKQISNVTASQLIKDNYLVLPVFEIDKKYSIDFAKLEVKKNGQFDATELNEVLSKNVRKTGLIMQQLVKIMNEQKRFGVFVFASTLKHCDECLASLPKNEAAIITGKTPQKKRTEILDKARKGEIKYLVNVSVLTVGIDVAPYDTVCYVRPTESLVLLTQTLGRGLRLATNKKDCLVIDCAGNIERHKDWDDPLLLDALKQTVNKDSDYIYQCFKCGCLNTEHARRCIGLDNGKSRCDYYFQFIQCSECDAKNDIAARKCRLCSAEIIDPNRKLNLFSKTSEIIKAKVDGCKYYIHIVRASLIITVVYTCLDIDDRAYRITEYYNLSTKLSRNICYAKFIKLHSKQASKYYLKMYNYEAMKEMLSTCESPAFLEIFKKNGKYQIKNKLWNNLD